MNFMTDALDRHGFIDPRYTCDLDNSSPEFRWDQAPEGTAAFVLLMHDPDAPSPPFYHWVVYRIPATLRHLPAGIPPQEQLPNGIRQGQNSFGKLGYAGPCPPRQSEGHRYIIELLALSLDIDLPPRLTGAGLLEAARPFLLGRAELIGRYRRQRLHAG